MLKTKHLLFFIPLFFFNYGSFAEDAADATAAQVAMQEVVLKVSKEAIASLEAQLSEEQFKFLEDEIVGKEYSTLDLNALLPKKLESKPDPEQTESISPTDSVQQDIDSNDDSTDSAEQTESAPAEVEKAEESESKEAEEASDSEEAKIYFSEEDIAKVQRSLDLYLERLNKIKAIAPLSYSVNDVSVKIQKLEDSIESLMKEEQETVRAEIEELKVQQKVYRGDFKTIAHQFDFENINFDKLPGMLADLGYEDEFHDVMYGQISEYLGTVKKLESANAIIESMEEVSQTILQAENDLKVAQTAEEKESITLKIKELTARKQELRRDFTISATGIDIAELDAKDKKAINLDEEMDKVFSPIIIALTDFTEPSRKIEFLRSDIAYYEHQIPKMRDGIAQIDILLSDAMDGELKNNLLTEKEFWEQHEKELSTKLEVAKQQLIELQDRKISPVAALNEFSKAIFSKRGKNIMFAVLIFFVMFLLIYLLRYLIVKLVDKVFSYMPKFKLIGAILNVFLYLMAFVVATLATIISLYISGEILALAIVGILLLGVLWTMKDNLPRFIEQIKLLLGYGPVRAGEKVIYNGIQWRVESISIYSYLKNPLLTGGTLRLPIKDLIGMRSRPYHEEETWFPCKEGDYVRINNKDWRKIVQQTPERMKFDLFGMYETMPTSNFLNQKVVNISVTPFWAGITFYIAYQHRFDVIDDIARKIDAFLKDAFVDLPFGEHLLSTWVECGEMTDTSLGLWVWVKMKPEAASSYSGINLAVTQISLKAANKYGWEVKRFHSIKQHEPDGLEGNSLKTLTDESSSE